MNAYTVVAAMRPRSLGRVFYIVVAAIALAGCGFHLQGASPLPEGIDAMHVSYYNAYRVGDPPVVIALEQRLRRENRLGGIDAPARLKIVSVDIGQHVVSISPVNGDAAEYALTTRVVFNYSVNGAGQLTGETLSATRNFSVDDTQRLSSEEKRNQLLRDMQQNLADLIFERIARSNQKLAIDNSHGAS